MPAGLFDLIWTLSLPCDQENEDDLPAHYASWLCEQAFCPIAAVSCVHDSFYLFYDHSLGCFSVLKCGYR